MSLARTALRFAAVETLLADQVIAQACPGRVFDSRIAPWTAAKPEPAIILTTEDDEGKAWSDNNGGPPFDRSCELILEISMWQSGEEDGQPFAFTPATDRELEAALDMLEERAVVALGIGETAQARLLRQVTRRISKMKSSRFPSDQTGVQLAIRLVTLTCELKGDDGDAADVSPGPYANLPDPLRSVCRGMPVGSSARATCDTLAAVMPPLVTLEDEAFAGVDVVFAPQNLSSDVGPSSGSAIGAAFDLPGAP